MMPAEKMGAIDAMPALIRLFVEIALHRKGPQDVPAASVVFALALLAYLVVGAAVLWPSSASMGGLLAHLTLDLVLLVLLVGGLLLATGRMARARQTLAAMFGTGALLSAAALPFVWIAARTIGDEGAVPGMEMPALLSAMALFLLLLASLFVAGHILRHALGWSYAAGVLVAVTYFAASLAVFRGVFPAE
jgi:hypothetical protein